jgi:hypothetical protein
VYARDALGEGDVLDGPCIVASLDATCLLLGGQRAAVDRFGNLVVGER